MIKLVDKIEDADCITHCGKIHADEVFSTAFLELLKEDIKVFRTSSIDFNQIKKDAIVYDIGLKEFDHHQKDPKTRPNGITYASFGLLWQSLGKKYLEKLETEDIEEIFNLFDQDLIEAIDADDNGIFPKIDAVYKVKTLSSVIDLFNPSYGSSEDENSQFIKAVAFAKEIIKEELLKLKGKIKAKKIAYNIIKEQTGNILELEEFIPYQETLLELDQKEEILFCIFPSIRGGYTVKTVPKSITDNTLRVPFPDEWKGLTDQKLEEVSGVKDATFCHNKCFIAASKTKESAYLLATKAIEIYKDKNN